MDCGEYRKIIAAHVDGALGLGEQETVESHLAVCPRCFRAYEQERRFQQTFKERIRIVSVPSELWQRLLVQLAQMEKQRFLTSALQRSLTFLQPQLAFAAVCLLLLTISLVYMWPSGGQKDLLRDVAETYWQFTAGKLVLDVTTDQPAELAAHFQRSEETASVAVVHDLSRKGYRLLGGKVKREKQIGILCIYRGVRTYLLCYHFSVEGFPFPSEGQVGEGRWFYSARGVSVLVVKEGSIVCVLASPLSQEELLSLAAMDPLGGNS